MKLNFSLVLIIAVAFFLVACGSSATPTAAPTPAPIPTEMATPAPTDTPRSDPVPTTQPSAGSDLGTLEVRVTAQPTDVVNSSVVTVGNIEVGVPGAPGEWSMVVAEPEEFDLLEIDGPIYHMGQ